MAKTISAEELQLRKRARRRLIGAIALVTIVAVFLPMFLDHEPKQVKQDISIQIPSSESGTFTSKVVPMAPGTPGPKSAPRAAPESAKPPPASKTEVAQASGAKPAETVPPAHDTEAAPPKAPAKPAPAPAVKSAPA